MQYARIPIPTTPPIRLHIYIAGPVSRMSWHMLRCTWNMHGRITVFFGEQNIPSSSSIGRRSSAARTTQTQAIPSRHGRAGQDGPSSRSPLTSQAHFEFVTFEKTERMSPSQPANVCEAFCSCLQVTATRTSPERGHCVARIKSGVRFPPALFSLGKCTFCKRCVWTTRTQVRVRNELPGWSLWSRVRWPGLFLPVLFLATSVAVHN